MTDPHSRMLRPAVAVLAAVLLAGCSTPDEPGEDSGPITVLAAASLTETFTTLAEEFEQAHAGADVTVSFGPSSGLAESIARGAPADVFAAADPVSMRRATEATAAHERPRIFARNRLQIAVPSGNPAGVTGLADFADEDLLTAICAPEVPCGRAAKAAFDAAGLAPYPATYGRDVKGVLTVVRTGEVDAGLVYRTDVAAAADVDGIDFPEADDAVNEYPITLLRESADAEAFVDFVVGERGREVLRAAGFEVP